MKSFDTSCYRFINYNEMSEDDNRKIWELRNHPSVRRWMVNDSFIPWESHKQFVSGLKNDESRSYFIIRDMEGDLIGSVNITGQGQDLVERGIYINPLHWHKGHAVKAMSEFYHYLKNKGVKGIWTRVKIDNYASNALERRLKAVLLETREGYNFYRTDL